MSKEWSRDFPQVQGVYFTRIDEDDKQPTPIRIEQVPNGLAVFEFGCAESFLREHETESYQYLGPITAEDSESRAALLAELADLKDLICIAVTLHHDHCHEHEPRNVSYESCTSSICVRSRAALRPRKVLAEKES